MQRLHSRGKKKQKRDERGGDKIAPEQFDFLTYIEERERDLRGQKEVCTQYIQMDSDHSFFMR